MNHKIFTIIFPIVLSSTTFAATNAVQRDQLYVGQEILVNGMHEQPTGNLCYIKIDDVRANPVGKHCYNFDFQFLSNRPDISKDIFSVQTRITNYHRPEYPTTKTCAMNVDGTTYHDDIYGDNTNDLVNDISAGDRAGRPKLDFFLSLSRETKLATRARIHFLSMLKEYSVDCAGLKLLGGPQSYELRFENEGVDATLSWWKQPNVGSDSIMLIQFKDFNKNNISLKSKLEVDLSMPSMGHGSSPVEIESFKDGNGNALPGLFKVKEMYFTMKGVWKINLKLVTDDNRTEEHSYTIDLGEVNTSGGHNH